MLNTPLFCELNLPRIKHFRFLVFLLAMLGAAYIAPGIGALPAKRTVRAGMLMNCVISYA